jgi:excisionase family DNA binding protein
MTVTEAARALEVAPRVVYDLCRAGLLGHQRIGVRRGVIRITEADLAAYVASRRVEPRGPAARETPATTLFNPLDRMRSERERRKASRS